MVKSVKKSMILRLSDFFDEVLFRICMPFKVLIADIIARKILAGILIMFFLGSAPFVFVSIFWKSLLVLFSFFMMFPLSVLFSSLCLWSLFICILFFISVFLRYCFADDTEKSFVMYNVIGMSQESKSFKWLACMIIDHDGVFVSSVGMLKIIFADIFIIPIKVVYRYIVACVK